MLTVWSIQRPHFSPSARQKVNAVTWAKCEYLQQKSIRNEWQQLFRMWLVVSRVSTHISSFEKGSYIPWVDLQNSRCIGSEMPRRHPQHRLQIENTPLASEGQTDPSSWAQWGSVVQFVTLAEKDHSQHVPKWQIMSQLLKGVLPSGGLFSNILLKMSFYSEICQNWQWKQKRKETTSHQFCPSQPVKRKGEEIAT